MDRVIELSIELGGYLVILLVAFMLLLSNFINFNSRKLRKNSGLLHRLYSLSENKYFKYLLYEPGSKGYKKTDRLLKNAGIRKLTVQQFQTIQWILPVIAFVFLLSVRYTNIAAAILNTDALNKIAELTHNESVAVVNKDLKVLPIMVVSMLFYFLPQGVLSVKKILRDKRGENEVLMLQTYTLMMLKAGNTVKATLIALMERANVYKKPLELAVKGYSKSPEDVLEELKERVGHPQFKKVVIALQQAINNDKSVSVAYLESNRYYDKELSKISRKEKTNLKKIIGLLLLGIPLVAFVIVIGWPWFTFAMRAMTQSY